MNTCNNIELHGFVLSLFTSAAGRRYLIGKQVADMLNKETFNLYQSMSRRGIDPERGMFHTLVCNFHSFGEIDTFGFVRHCGTVRFSEGHRGCSLWFPLGDIVTL